MQNFCVATSMVTGSPVTGRTATAPDRVIPAVAPPVARRCPASSLSFVPEPVCPALCGPSAFHTDPAIVLDILPETENA